MARLRAPSLRLIDQSERDAGTDLGKSHRAQISRTYLITTGGSESMLKSLQDEAEQAGWHTDFSNDVSFTSTKRTEATSAQLRVTLTEQDANPAVLVQIEGI